VHSTKAAEFVKESDAYLVPSSAPGAEVRYLSTASWPIQPFVVTLAPGARVDDLSHAGAEFIHGLEGTMTMLVNGERYEISSGDTLVIPEHVEHAYLNETSSIARIVGGAERSQNDSGRSGPPKGGRTRPSSSTTEEE
jgi:gentisate 1,2-dioxygenase